MSKIHNIKFIFQIFLWPFSVIYGIVVGIRNWCFDKGILRSKSYEMPIISVGNLAVGGTGKTPHTEYLIRLLKDKYQIATLSRGYGRKSSGFVLADEKSTAKIIGDEPFQMWQKFRNIKVAVCESRCNGVEKLMSQFADLQVVLLDDAYQHRYIKSGLSVVLTDYNRPLATDNLLPMGRLREPKKNINRADVVIVTKCPADLSDAEMSKIAQSLHLGDKQELFFSTLQYENLHPLFVKNAAALENTDLRNKTVLLLTGIAHPELITNYLSNYAKEVVPMTYSDHHSFSDADFLKIEERFCAIPSDEKIIVTTEKDAARLRNFCFAQHVMENVYTLGIKVEFLQQKEEIFNKKILDYVEKNRRSR